VLQKLALGLFLSLISLAAQPVAAANPAQHRQFNSVERAELLKTREAVWRAWFANDHEALEKFLPDDLIGINNGEEKWDTRAIALEGAAQFAADGGRLVRLEFPHTEIQVFGDVVVLYSLFTTETEVHGQRTVSSGRATEIFVRRDGYWLNAGWHLDSGK
jgi:hypothetical protein